MNKPEKITITMEDFTEDELRFVDLLGSMLNYPRWKKAEILYGDYSGYNIAKVDFLQDKYYPEY